MSERHPTYGLALATAGALIITPDTLFMRLTAMSGLAMLAWRGLSVGVIFISLWLGMRRHHLAADLRLLRQPAGLAVILIHSVNAALFSLGIANAPVSVVLFAVAPMPIFAALFAHLFAGERTGLSTWIATLAVMAGIGIAVFGRDAAGVGFNLASLIGALAGLGVAAALAATFVIIRHVPGLPILPVMGLGTLISGSIAALLAGSAAMGSGHVWAALVSAALILPLSFLALTQAARHTAAVNVSLLMLLETILGPLWGWWGFGEAMSRAQIAGGLLVVVSLALYLWQSGRQSPPRD
ncbi:MAG: DMT family transporter [Rhodobacteraceae bacterium]|nr:DMT family transporter [Paracoccaceae bacterium]